MKFYEMLNNFQNTLPKMYVFFVCLFVFIFCTLEYLLLNLFIVILTLFTTSVDNTAVSLTTKKQENYFTFDDNAVSPSLLF